MAQVSALAGYTVVTVESNDAALNAGSKRYNGLYFPLDFREFAHQTNRIEDSLKKFIAKDIQKGKLTEVNYPVGILFYTFG